MSKMDIQHDPIQFRTTLFTENGFVHYGFNIINGTAIPMFIEEISRNGQRGNLFKCTEIFHQNRGMGVPDIPKKVWDEVNRYATGYMISQFSLKKDQ